MAYYIALEPPNYDQAYAFACELESAATDRIEINAELAQFYVSWSLALKMRFDLDPLKDMRRQKQYKDLADKAIELLRKVPDSPSRNHLLAQSYYNKWDYDTALRHIEKALEQLPNDSHLVGPYNRLRSDVLKKRAFYGSTGKWMPVRGRG
jgi:tetratricopeptide (TPR) repeat protein